MFEFIRELETDDEDSEWDDWDRLPPYQASAAPVEPTATKDRLDTTLTREIGSLRRLLTRLEATIDTEEEPDRLVLPLTRLVESIARTIRIHKGVADPAEQEFHDAVTRVFRDKGLLAWDDPAQ